MRGMLEHSIQYLYNTHHLISEYAIDNEAFKYMDEMQLEKLIDFRNLSSELSTNKSAQCFLKS